MLSVKDLQRELAERGLYPADAIDGISGKNTRAAIDAALAKASLASDWLTTWTDERRAVAFAQLAMRTLGIETGAIDGLIGEQTRYAFSVYAARKRGDKSVETWRDAELAKPAPAIVPPKQAAWPRQQDCTAFFGSIGTKQVTLIMPFPLRIAWDLAKTTRHVTCHEKVSPALGRIWQRTLDHYGYDKLRDLRLDVFGGCLNVRKMRGGSAYSMHSWGIAWDVDPDRNQLKWTRAHASLDDPPYAPFWGFVYDEGAISLGLERDFDFMHFQFARF